MKINKIKDDDVLELEEFMNKYKYEFDKEEISQEAVDNIFPMIKEEYEWKIHKYIGHIKDIYIAILEIEKSDYPNGSIESFYKLIKHICCLKYDIDFEYYKNKKDLCQKAYDELYSNGIDTKYMKEKMPEQFKEKHLLDIAYHANCFKKYKISKDLRNELNNGNWRFI